MHRLPVYDPLEDEKKIEIQKAGGAAKGQLRGRIQPFELDVVSTNGGKRDNRS